MSKYYKTVIQRLWRSQCHTWPVQRKAALSYYLESQFNKDGTTCHDVTAKRVFPNDCMNILSFKALRKAGKVLGFVSSIYSHSHNLNQKDYLTYADILCFVEGALYLIDDNNEGGSGDKDKLLQFDFSNLYSISSDEFRINLDRNRYLAVLYAFLNDHGFYDSYVARQLRDGLLFYKLEQWCLRCIRDANERHHLSEDLILRCNALHSYDIRMLNLLVYQLTKQPYNQEYLDFFYNHEKLLEIFIDLQEYRKEVLDDSFNVYRMYVHLYPNIEQCKAQFTKFILDSERDCCAIPAYIKLKYPNFMDLLRETLIEYHKDMKTPKSNKAMGERLWSLPEPIVDEQKFRADPHF